MVMITNDGVEWFDVHSDVLCIGDIAPARQVDSS